jgi:hypothetical protein
VVESITVPAGDRTVRIEADATSGAVRIVDSASGTPLPEDAPYDATADTEDGSRRLQIPFDAIAGAAGGPVDPEAQVWLGRHVELADGRQLRTQTAVVSLSGIGEAAPAPTPPASTGSGEGTDSGERAANRSRDRGDDAQDPLVIAGGFAVVLALVAAICFFPARSWIRRTLRRRRRQRRRQQGQGQPVAEPAGVSAEPGDG